MGITFYQFGMIICFFAGFVYVWNNGISWVEIGFGTFLSAVASLVWPAFAFYFGIKFLADSYDKIQRG